MANPLHVFNIRAQHLQSPSIYNPRQSVHICNKFAVFGAHVYS